MPEPYNYTALLGGPDTGIPEAIRAAILGQQQQQQGSNALEQQRLQLEALHRADEARKAQAALVMQSGGFGQPAQQAAMPDQIAVTNGGALPPVQTAPMQGQMPANAQPDTASLMATIAADNPANAQAIIAAQHRAIDTSALMADPSPRNVMAFMVKYPDVHEALSKGWEVLSGGAKEAALRTSVDVKGYLESGDSDKAVAALESHMAADKAAGVDVSGYPQLIALIKTNPNGAKALANMNVAAAMGPDKFGETYDKMAGADKTYALLPSDVATNNANASIKQTEAAYKPNVIQSDLKTAEAQRAKWVADTQIAVDNAKLGWAKLDLDKDTLATQTALKLQELQLQGSNLDSTARGAVNTAVTSAVTDEALGNRAKDLAATLRVSGARGGFGSSWAEVIKSKTGNQDSVSQLRSEYNQFINSAALKMLPPGSASDKDVAFVKQGFPADTAPPEYVAKWLDSYSRIKFGAAQASERQGDWLAANRGSLGRAGTDITVGGVLVPAGTTFTEFNRNAIKVNSKDQPPAGVRAIINKYGSK